jgi:hypothetical protein
MDRFRTLYVLCGAIALSLLMVNLVLTVLFFSRSLPAAGTPGAISLVLFSLGVLLLAAAPAIKRAVFKRAEAEGFDGDRDRRFAAYQRANIVACAMREAGGLIGFVLALRTANPWWSWGLGGAALIAMIVDRPRPGMLG